MGIDLGRFRAGKQSQEWLDWLRDEPTPPQAPVASRGARNESRVRGAPMRPSARIAAELSGREVGSNQSPNSSRFRVAVPSFAHNLKRHAVQFANRMRTVVQRYPRQIAVGGALAVVVVAGGITYMTLSDQKATSDQPAVLAESTTKPNFTYALPDGDASSIDGTVRFDPKRKVVNYKDTVAGVSVTVSQQQLPEGLKEDSQEKIKKIAADFSATRALTTATPTAYIGDSIEGPQTVIFTKKDLLIFVLSANKVDDKDWAEYVTTLR